MIQSHRIQLLNEVMYRKPTLTYLPRIFELEISGTALDYSMKKQTKKTPK